MDKILNSKQFYDYYKLKKGGVDISKLPFFIFIKRKISFITFRQNQKAEIICLQTEIRGPRNKKPPCM